MSITNRLLIPSPSLIPLWLLFCRQFFQLCGTVEWLNKRKTNHEKELNIEKRRRDARRVIWISKTFNNNDDMPPIKARFRGIFTIITRENSYTRMINWKWVRSARGRVFNFILLSFAIIFWCEVPRFITRQQPPLKERWGVIELNWEEKKNESRRIA